MLGEGLINGLLRDHILTMFIGAFIGFWVGRYFLKKEFNIIRRELVQAIGSIYNIEETN